MIRRTVTVAIATCLMVTLPMLLTAAANPVPARPGLTPAEEAFAVASARALDVDPATTDHAAAIAGGRNACYLIGVFGLDPVTLDGWDEHWHQAWEREWLAAAVTYLCPAGG